MLTIVMYHYVRDLANTPFPSIKGLATSDFEVQLDHIARRYEVVGLDDVLAAAEGERALPRDACLLTFDDGFVDHHETVFPRLRARGMRGAFFPPGRPVLEHVPLDVHKLHFILAAASSPGAVAERMLEELDRLRSERALPSEGELRARYESEDRFDSPETMLIKGVLQHGLPARIRAALVQRMFTHFVDDDEQAFARELYMGLDQLRELLRGGMAIGGHGWAHEWLGKLPRAAQSEELSRTAGLLELVHGAPPSAWTMCYPYGSYNAETLELVSEHGAVLGLTTKPDVVADFSRPFELERLDTNDLPPRAC
jgi:peptidoglycan/xylan/chitin deacetylase (PgdA/CDA1 family)